MPGSLGDWWLVKSGVYELFSKFDDRTYVGSSVNMEKRIQGHWSDLLKKKHHNPKLQNFVNKYGIDSLGFRVLQRCGSHRLLEREQYYIDTLKPSFNICRKAGSVLGIKRSRESVEKTRKALLGRKCPWMVEVGKRRKGTKLTEETKRKIGIANSGRKDPALAERNRERCTGKALSEEHKKKLSEAGKGQKRPHLLKVNRIRKQFNRERIEEEFVGKRFYHLIVCSSIRVVQGCWKGRLVLKCLCDCGSYCTVAPHRLKTGEQTTCGCRLGRCRRTSKNKSGN